MTLTHKFLSIFVSVFLYFVPAAVMAEPESNTENVLLEVFKSGCLANVNGKLPFTSENRESLENAGLTLVQALPSHIPLLLKADDVQIAARKDNIFLFASPSQNVCQIGLFDIHPAPAKSIIEELKEKKWELKDSGTKNNGDIAYVTYELPTPDGDVLVTDISTSRKLHCKKDCLQLLVIVARFKG